MRQDLKLQWIFHVYVEVYLQSTSSKLLTLEEVLLCENELQVLIFSSFFGAKCDSQVLRVIKVEADVQCWHRDETERMQWRRMKVPDRKFGFLWFKIQCHPLYSQPAVCIQYISLNAPLYPIPSSIYLPPSVIRPLFQPWLLYTVTQHSQSASSTYLHPF